MPGDQHKGITEHPQPRVDHECSFSSTSSHEPGNYKVDTVHQECKFGHYFGSGTFAVTLETSREYNTGAFRTTYESISVPVKDVATLKRIRTLLDQAIAQGESNI